MEILTSKNTNSCSIFLKGSARDIFSEVNDKQRRISAATQAIRNRTGDAFAPSSINSFPSLIAHLKGGRAKRGADEGSCDSCCIPGHPGRPGPPGPPGQPGTPGAPGRPGNE
jgi:hypothetical protein